MRRAVVLLVVSLVVAACATMSQRGPDLVGRAVQDVLLPPGPDGAPSPFDRSPIHGACADGQARDLRAHVFLHKDGSSVPVDYVATPFRQGGRITGAVITFRDISERALS